MLHQQGSRSQRPHNNENHDIYFQGGPEHAMISQKDRDWIRSVRNALSPKERLGKAQRHLKLPQIIFDDYHGSLCGICQG
jgi:hypothetical protein